MQFPGSSCSSSRNQLHHFLFMVLLVLLPTSCRCFLSSNIFSVNTQERRTRLTWKPSATVLLYQASSSSSSSSTASRKNQIAALLQWATANKIGISPKIALESDAASLGLGWFFTNQKKTNKSSSTTKEKSENDLLLLTVPSSMALVVESGFGPDNSRTRDLFRSREAFKAFLDLPWYVQMALYLFQLDQIDSTKNGKDGTIDLKPWLNALPRTLDTPLDWTAGEMESLQYDYMTKAVQRQERKWKGFYGKVQTLLVDNNNLSWQDFCWGCETARSRAFSGSYTPAFDPKFFAFLTLLIVAYLGLGLGTLEQAANGAGVVFSVAVLKDFVLPKLTKTKRYVICPVIDMANHNAKAPNAQVSFEFFGNAYSLATTKSTSGCDDDKDDPQVYISYGSRSNDQLLQYYGFIESDNPSDVYIMPPLREWDIRALEQACGRTMGGAGRLEKLANAGLLGKATDSAKNDDNNNDAFDDENVANPDGGVVVNRVDGLDPAVLQALRALVSTDQEWNVDAGQAIGNFCEPLNAENEAAARLAAKTRLEMELLSKPTTLQQDQDLLRRITTKKSGGMMDADLMMSRHEKLALQFRIEKKKVLMEAIEKLS